MPKILDGRACAEHIYDRIKALPADQKKDKGLAILTVGHDNASKVYVRNKIKACEKCGIPYKVVSFDEESVTTAEITNIIMALNNSDTFSGIIVQLPLPKKLNQTAIRWAIDPRKDVDGFRPRSPYLPCTPEGILHLLRENDIPLTKRMITVIGRSDLVGKPMAQMLLALDNTVTVCHSKTEPWQKRIYCQYSDIIICATGHPNTINPHDIAEKMDLDTEWYSVGLTAGPVIVDVGINRDENDKLCGDVNPACYNPEWDIVSAYTPVPGGVGPMTVATLLEHTVFGPTSLDHYKGE